MANGFPVQRILMPEGSTDIDLSGLELDKCKGVLLSGGNDSVTNKGSRRVPQLIMDLPVPKLGICYGQQALVDKLGGVVSHGTTGEYGIRSVKLEESRLFRAIPGDTIKALNNHKDVVTVLPEGCRTIAQSPAGIAGITNDDDIYAVQFHPESSHTDYGTQILLNFATEICGMHPEPGFTPDTYRQRVVEQQTVAVQKELGGAATRSIILDSGGVDSATAHALTHEALRPLGREHSLSGIYIDTGMMRHEDGDTIRIMNERGYPVESQDWSQFFLHESVPLPKSEAKIQGYTHLTPMDQTTDPAIMRKIIKYGFVEVQRRIGLTLRERFSDAEIIALVQGTNLADKIESGDHAGDQIKEHHNSGIEAFVDKLFEPMSTLFKGDIRLIALTLGLPPVIALRQPFPGPGLCLRLPANATGETIWPDDYTARRNEVERICASVGDGALSGCWLPVKARGQKGDEGFTDYITILSGKYDPELIEKLAFDIPDKTHAARVLFTEDEVDPDQVTSVRQMVNETHLKPLRDIEEIKRQALLTNPLGSELSQHYVASLPVSLNGSEKTTLMTRMFRTGVRSGLEDYIDGEAALGGLNVDDTNFHGLLDIIARSAVAHGYGAAVYDATNKPPGTVELA